MLQKCCFRYRRTHSDLWMKSASGEQTIANMFRHWAVSHSDEARPVSLTFLSRPSQCSMYQGCQTVSIDAFRQRQARVLLHSHSRTRKCHEAFDCVHGPLFSLDKYLLDTTKTTNKTHCPSYDFINWIDKHWQLLQIFPSSKTGWNLVLSMWAGRLAYPYATPMQKQG